MLGYPRQPEGGDIGGEHSTVETDDWEEEKITKTKSEEGREQGHCNIRMRVC